MDWTHLLSAAAGVVLLAAAHYVRTGKPPLFDPESRYPAFDLVRDGLRKALLLLKSPEDQPPAV